MHQRVAVALMKHNSFGMHPQFPRAFGFSVPDFVLVGKTMVGTGDDAGMVFRIAVARIPTSYILKHVYVYHIVNSTGDGILLFEYEDQFILRKMRHILTTMAL
jgi:hypothetical protein